MCVRLLLGGRRTLVNALLVACSVTLGLALAEGAYRAVLFGQHPLFEGARKPGHFADYFSDDDYWKLYYRFGGAVSPPTTPHPLLGWTGDFDRESYLHHETSRVSGRRPVLLFGDSFAACVDGVECFEDVLNRDPAFADSHYLLNYGVGGYGTDQILLLAERVLDRYDDPLVVVSLMTLDLDRSVLSVRIGQKPYFVIERGDLELRGIPIDSDPESYFAAHPPGIRSYVYRRLAFSGLLPEAAARVIRGEAGRRAEKLAINEAILERLLTELSERGLEHVFLVFHPNWPGVSALNDERDWRGEFLEGFFGGREVPVMWARDILRRDAVDDEPSLDRYFLPDDGHPTSYYNSLVAEEIADWVLSGGHP